MGDCLRDQTQWPAFCLTHTELSGYKLGGHNVVCIYASLKKNNNSSYRNLTIHYSYVTKSKIKAPFTQEQYY